MRISQNPLQGPVSVLDDVDRRIIADLQVDGRRPYSRIAEDAEVSESAIRYRVQKLERAGILQIVGIANPLRLGFDLMSLVQVTTSPGTMRAVADEINTYPEVSYIAATAGNYDLLVEVVCRDTAHFNEFLTERLQQIPAVTSTDSSLILEIRKMAYGWGVVGERAPMAKDAVTPTAANEGLG